MVFLSRARRYFATLTILACLIVLAASQALSPAARIAGMAAGPDTIAIAAGIAPAGNGDATQLRHCVMVKLGTIHLNDALAPPAACALFIAAPASDRLPASMTPGVLIPPPRRA